MPTKDFVLDSFVLKSGKLQFEPGEQIWFKFSLHNADAVDKRGWVIGVQARRNFVFQNQCSYGGEPHDVLHPGEALTWEDHIELKTPGEYDLYLGVCWSGSKGQCQSESNWEILSEPIRIQVGVPEPIPNGQNLLTNSGFETGTTFGWEAYYLGVEPKIGFEDRENGARLVYEGRYALRFEREWVDPGKIFIVGIRQHLSLVKGRRYRLTVPAYLMAWANDPDKNRIREISSKIRALAIWHEANVIRQAEIGGDIGWQKAVLEFTAVEALTTIQAEAQIGAEYAANFSYAHFDGLELICLDSPPPAPTEPVYEEVYRQPIGVQTGEYRSTLVVERRK